jgi:hypothetical protein
VWAASAEPDLILTHGELSPSGGDQVIVGRGVEGFDWGQRTKNVGDAASPRSDTVVTIGSKILPGAIASIPRLAPGARRFSIGRFQVNFRNWEFGTYPTEICADALGVVTESEEGNNCRALAPIHVVPSRLRGRVTGKVESLWPAKTFDVAWAADVTYDSPRILYDPVRIDYAFSEVSVIYTVYGTDLIGCTYSGTGTDTPPSQGIRLWFGPQHGYRAENNINLTFQFPVTQKCPGSRPSTVVFTPTTKQWFYTHGFRRFQNPGLEALRGNYIFNVAGVKKVTWSWHLVAE